MSDDGKLTVDLRPGGRGSGGPVEIEVRDHRMHLVRAVNAGETVELPAGLYDVSAQLPDGSRTREVVTLGAGGAATVELSAAPAPARARVAARAATRRSVSRPTKGGGGTIVAPSIQSVGVDTALEGLAATPAVSLRFWRFDRSGVRRAPASECRIEAVERDDALMADALRARLRADGEGPYFGQVAAAGTIPVFVALPMSDSGSDTRVCELTVAAPGTARPVVEARTVGAPRVEQLAEALERGALPAAAKLAEGLLYSKGLHPFGAALGGYALLRLGALTQMHGWEENLAQWFRWLPDGAVIAGERALREGDGTRAVGWFLEAAERGLPVFTDGYSVLLDRLRALGDAPDRKGGAVDADQAEAARAAWRRMKLWSRDVAFDSVVTQVRCGDLADPRRTRDQTLAATPESDGWVPLDPEG